MGVYKVYRNMGKAMSVQRNGASVISSKHKDTIITQRDKYINRKTMAVKKLDPTSEYTRTSNRLDAAFNERLKQIYVTSDVTNYRVGPTNISSGDSTMEKSLDEEQAKVEKLTLNQLNSLLLAKQTNPDEWTPSKASQHYKLRAEDAVNLLKYFGCFEVYVPDPKDNSVEETVSGMKIQKPETLPNRITTNTSLEEMQKITRAKKK